MRVRKYSHKCVEIYTFLHPRLPIAVVLRHFLHTTNANVTGQFCEQGKPGHYNVGDIIVGGTIDVYGRRFHVIDADRATRRFLKERLGRVEAPAIPFPTDRFTVQRKEFMSRETGCDSTVRHGIVKVKTIYLPRPFRWDMEDLSSKPFELALLQTGEPFLKT